jgi:hypothetical protein
MINRTGNACFRRKLPITVQFGILMGPGLVGIISSPTPFSAKTKM